MNRDVLELIVRIVAKKNGRAMPIARTFDVIPDQGPSFIIAPIRVVSEERTQAVAFGDADGSPQLAREALPLGRSTDFLEPFAEALNTYLTSPATCQHPRIYVPHAQALEQLSLIGERYEHNKEASEKIRRLGYLCRMLHEVCMIPGQQIVLSLAEVLARHVVSGGMPIKDLQLSYLLAWMDPPAGQDVQEAAERAALRPKAAMLHVDDDERVEKLRHEYKRHRTDSKRKEIEDILDRNATEEWDAAVAARRALWNLGLGSNALLFPVYRENVKWLNEHLPLNLSAPSKTIAMSRLLDDHNIANFDHHAALVANDELTFQAERAKGRAFVARVKMVDRRGVGRTVGPVYLHVAIQQPLVRLRTGARIRMVNSPITASVVDVNRRDDGSAIYDVRLLVDNGLRDAARLATDTEIRLADGQRFDARFVKGDVYRRASAFQNPLIFGTALPTGTGVVDKNIDLTAVLSRLEQRA